MNTSLIVPLQLQVDVARIREVLGIIAMAHGDAFWRHHYFHRKAPLSSTSQTELAVQDENATKMPSQTPSVSKHVLHRPVEPTARNGHSPDLQRWRVAAFCGTSLPAHTCRSTTPDAASQQSPKQPLNQFAAIYASYRPLFGTIRP